MKKIVLLGTLFAIGFILLYIGVVSGYRYIVHTLQVSNITTLGWEGERYLWGAGAFGVIRWNVEQETTDYSSFEPDGIDQFFTSQEGQVWAYGHGVWRFEYSWPLSQDHEP